MVLGSCIHTQWYYCGDFRATANIAKVHSRANHPSLISSLSSIFFCLRALKRRETSFMRILQACLEKILTDIASNNHSLPNAVGAIVECPSKEFIPGKIGE